MTMPENTPSAQNASSYMTWYCVAPTFSIICARCALVRMSEPYKPHTVHCSGDGWLSTPALSSVMPSNPVRCHSSQ